MDYLKTVEIPTEEYRQLIEDMVNAKRDAEDAERRVEEMHGKYLSEWSRAEALQKKNDEMSKQISALTDLCNCRNCSKVNEDAV